MTTKIQAAYRIRVMASKPTADEVLKDMKDAGFKGLKKSMDGSMPMITFNKVPLNSLKALCDKLVSLNREYSPRKTLGYPDEEQTFFLNKGTGPHDYIQVSADGFAMGFH